MISLYLDSNAVFRLGEERALLAATQAAQESRAFRVVIGWTTVWELAGAFDGDVAQIEKARADALVVLKLVESGGRFAKSPFNVALEALWRPRANRWRTGWILHPGSREFHDALGTVRSICEPARDAATLGWYKQYSSQAELFKVAEQEFRNKIRSLAGDMKPQLSRGLATGLDDLEEKDWLPRATSASARALGYRRKIPPSISSDWFGPLGRMHRASIAFAMLHATSPSAAAIRPKYSDFADVMHVIAGGLVRRFVTKDEVAKSVFNATWPSNSRSAMLFPGDFARFLQAHVHELRSKAAQQAG